MNEKTSELTNGTNDRTSELTNNANEKTSELKLGINENVSNSQYHNDRSYLSSSVLKTLYISVEAYYNQYILGDKAEVPPALQASFDVGSAVHCKILEPHLYSSDFNFFPGLRKAGEAFQAFVSEISSEKRGKPILSKPQQVAIDAMVESFNACKTATDLLDIKRNNCFVEHTGCTWIHGTPIKARADFIDIDRGIIADIKTTSASNEPGVFKEVCDKLYYNLSGALYCMVFQSIYNKPFDFYFVTLSKTSNDCRVYKLSEKSKAVGQHMIKTACERLLHAKLTNNWKDDIVDTVEEVDEIEEV